jgi:hypothetical protein
VNGDGMGAMAAAIFAAMGNELTAWVRARE